MVLGEINNALSIIEKLNNGEKSLKKPLSAVLSNYLRM